MPLFLVTRPQSMQKDGMPTSVEPKNIADGYHLYEHAWLGGLYYDMHNTYIINETMFSRKYSIANPVSANRSSCDSGIMARG